MKAKQCIAAMVTAGCVLGVAPAVASAAEPQQAASGNWAGYVVNDSTGKNFKSVSASWTQPTANCTSAGQYAAFWVGLGGAGQGSQKLEQAGTEAECGNDGNPTYFAWYELVPSGPVTLGLSVKPGDHIYTRVVANGNQVTISLSNQTTGQSTTKTLSMSDPDTSSAEWIAEAPSQCQQGVSNCQELPLADFGTVHFNNAYATDTDGHTGSVSDSQWSPVAVTLSGGDASQGFGDSEFVSASGSAGATPSNLSSSGASFSVSYAGDGSSGGTSGYAGYGGGAPSGYGSGSGYDSGYPGGYGGGGYGYDGGGYGGGGYGGGGYGYGYGGGGYGYY
jgi:Peptidase A4 family